MLSKKRPQLILELPYLHRELLLLTSLQPPRIIHQQLRLSNLALNQLPLNNNSQLRQILQQGELYLPV